MTSSFFKKRNQLFFAVGLVFWALSVEGQSATEKYAGADSLFLSGRYTESLRIYEQLLLEDKQFSPSMLLKMAYTHEGLDEPYDALFYLEQYYKYSREQAAVEKISTLASAFDLRGYESTDSNLLLRWYGRYHQELALLLLGSAALFFALLVYRYRKHAERPPILFIAMSFCLLLAYASSERIGIRKQAMLYGESILMMSGPSAGSQLLEQSGPGHKVEVLGTNDIWSRIRWKEREVYVKSTFLKEI
jgi:hypothetical protein